MMISRQRERISSGLTSLIREHNSKMNSVQVGGSHPSSSPSSAYVGGAASMFEAPAWSRSEKLLGLCNPPAFDVASSSSSELHEEEVWAIAEDISNRFKSSSNWAQSSSSSSSNWEGNISRIQTRSSRIHKAAAVADSSELPAASAPMNVPNWSKILQKKSPNSGSPSPPSSVIHDDEEEIDPSDEHQEEWIPPHQLAARQESARIRTSCMVAFSVLEGAGRTLKGRDLSRVRNAVWQQTGYLGC